MNEAETIFQPSLEAPAARMAGPLLGTGGRVRLRTLTRIRWVAIAGQLAALFLVRFGLDWPLPMDAALTVVGVSVVLNLVMTFRHPEQGRLKEWEAAAYLAFDTLQLALLLYLTGGLTNPFALLFLGPVTVSATVLTRRATAILCGLVIVCATALVFGHLPLPWSEIGLELPGLYVWGLWTAVVIGTLFLAVYAGSLAAESRRMSNALSETQLSLAREQQLSAVGGLAAAAAHELGSPLSTILVTATELSRELPDDSPYAEDISILRAEALRCREILAELSLQPSTNDTSDPFSRTLLSAMVAAAANRHRSADIELQIESAGDDDSDEPVVANSPEFNHGLGNIVQNAVQFARNSVAVRVAWNRQSITVTVRDDGPGFAPAVLDRVGEPYISSRGEGHLGLGIFIAQSLLQRTGGQLAVRNLRGTGGRVEGGEVMITWPRASLEVSASAG
ncbi:MAG: ActS/PrrB/RegB family redox-sensitive histidine kinase [Alphaproteobacteria bacterium]|nr:ActS/PrrB/RegB family redox-sensitive histidine kinase [Alphaproteobacteria bacterium]